MRAFLAASLLAVVSACYSPSIDACRLRCGGADDLACPSGLSCVSGFCSTGEACGAGSDAAPDDGTQMADAPIDAVACAVPGTYRLDPVVELTTPTRMGGVVLIDVDGDTHLDIVAHDGIVASSALGTYLGDGAGGFGARIGAQGAIDGGKLVPAGDLDGNGRPDLIAITSNGYVVYRNNPAGTFFYVPTGTTPSPPSDIVAAHLDADMTLDLAITMPATSNIWLGRGMTTPISWEPETAVPTGATPVALAAANVNVGQSLDLLVALSGQSFLGFHAGRPAAYAFDDVTLTTVSGAPSAIAVGDLGGSTLTAVLVSETTDRVSIRRYSSGTVFGDVGGYDVGDSPRGLALVDVDVDGRLDIVVANHASNTLSVLLASGPSSFTRVLPDLGVSSGPEYIAVGDLNQDGRDDLVIGRTGTSALQVLLNLCPL
jgi:hypothetical protein